MSSVQFSAIGPVISGGKAAAAATGDPAAPAAANRGQIATALRGSSTVAPGNGPDAGSAQTAANAAPPPANQSSDAIGTQLVLVYDDQTRSMKVKLLDIRTQKVDQSLLPETASTDAATAATEATSGGTHVDTKA